MVLRRGAFLKCVRPNQTFLQIEPLSYLGFAIALLCIFMTIPTPSSHHYLDLAVCEHARKIPKMLREDAVLITVTRDGSVYFRNTKVPREELPNRIHDAVLNGAEKRVYLRVDARAQYGDVGALLPYIQLAGIREITFPMQTSPGGTL